jgi:hypothetical protein
MSSPILRKIGIGMILVGIGPLIYSKYLEHSHDWVPLKVPVVLTPGEFRSSEFTTDLDGRYLIILAFDLQPDLLREQCLMGISWSYSRCNVNKALAFDWRVISGDGEVIRSGSYEPRSVSGSEVTFGDFPGKRKARFRAILEIKQDAGELNAARPKVIVQAGPENWEALPDLRSYSVVWAITLCLVGLLCVLLADRIHATLTH